MVDFDVHTIWSIMFLETHSGIQISNNLYVCKLYSVMQKNKVQYNIIIVLCLSPIRK